MEDDFIEIYDDLNIENFSLNSDKKIITIIQKNKIKFFSTNNFKEFSDNLGDKFNNIKICLPIYSSEYVLIVGNKENKIFKYNSIIIYNLENEEISAKININLEDEEEIINLYLILENLFILTNDKIYYFDIVTLKLIYIFEDVKGNKNLVKISNDNLKIVLCYVSNLNPNVIKIIKIKFPERLTLNKKNNQILYSQSLLTSDFNSIQFISVSPLGKYLAVINEEGSKINIYSLRSYKARKFLWRGNGKVNIIECLFDDDSKYLCVLSDQKTFHIYSILRKYIKKIKNQSFINKINEEEEQKNANKEIKESSFSGFFNYIRNKWGTKYIECFAKYKNTKVTDFDLMGFYFNEKKEIIAIDKIGKVLVIKFNKKNGGMCWLHDKKYLEVNDI